MTEPAPRAVWVVFIGNYFPREVEGIYTSETAAKDHAATDDSLDYESWGVADKYESSGRRLSEERKSGVTK